jgi:hypothetical protein
VGSHRGLAFQNRQSEARSKAKELERRREAHDAGTDDSDIMRSRRPLRTGHVGLSAPTTEGAVGLAQKPVPHPLGTPPGGVAEEGDYLLQLVRRDLA